MLIKSYFNILFDNNNIFLEIKVLHFITIDSWLSLGTPFRTLSMVPLRPDLCRL